MAKLFANSGKPDYTPHSALSDLGLCYLPITLLGISILKWVNLSAQVKYWNDFVSETVKPIEFKFRML